MGSAQTVLLLSKHELGLNKSGIERFHSRFTMQVSRICHASQSDLSRKPLDRFTSAVTEAFDAAPREALNAWQALR